MVCGRVSGCCRLSTTVSARRWKLPTTLPGKTHPRETPPGVAATSGEREKQRREDALVCPGSQMSLVPGCRSSLSPAVHPRPAGMGQGTPSAQGHSSKCPHPLPGLLCRKPLAQPPESAAASRHHLKSHSRPVASCRRDSISMLSHGGARVGAPSQWGTMARGDGGHLGHSRATGTGPQAAQLFCCPSPQGHTPGPATPRSHAQGLPSEAGSHGGHSGALRESHQDHTGPPCDHSHGSLATSSPHIAWEHNVLLNELQV